MKAKVIPQHAELPLWTDKSTVQKLESLSILFNDLKNYAEDLNITVNENINDNQNPDDKRLYILSEYQKVLSRANADLIQKLEQINPFDERERLDIAAAIDFISKNPNALNMNCEAGHVVGSGLVIHPETSRILLHKHKKLGLWLQFGGHADYETDVAKVAARETAEETGLNDLSLVSIYNDASIPADIDVQIFDKRNQIPPHYHFDMRFLFVTNMPDKIIAAEDESGDFWWLPIEEALNLPEEKIGKSLKRLITKADSYIKTKHLKQE